MPWRATSCPQDVVGGLDGDVGQQRHGLGDFGEVGQAGDVAHHHVADHPGAQPAQHRLEGVVVDLLVAQEIAQGGGVEGRADAGGEARASQLRLSSWRRRKREQARASRMGWGRAVGCSDMVEADW
jgi:hypothetical protein